jgi:hypothetical protein
MALRTLRDRQLALALVALLATMAATVAHAAASAHAVKPGKIDDASRQALKTPLRQTLLVPEVTRSAFVFAKMTLSDAGFGWRVTGPVGGYPSSVVVSQWPHPGARVLDTGAPVVTLRLRANPAAKRAGYPQNLPLYPVTAIDPVRG